MDKRSSPRGYAMNKSETLQLVSLGGRGCKWRLTGHCLCRLLIVLGASSDGLRAWRGTGTSTVSEQIDLEFQNNEPAPSVLPLYSIAAVPCSPVVRARENQCILLPF